MRVVVIIQARMGSTRLPGKVLKLLKNKTVLSHVIDRCRSIKLADEIVVATTILPTDDSIEKEALQLGAKCYRGSEDDVLSRYFEAATECNADVIVRITSDCPLIDPYVSNEIINRFLTNEVDYCSNTIIRSYPRGLDTEVFSYSVLEKAYYQAKLSYEREHVTPYIYRNPELFTLDNYVYHQDHSRYRWTLDTIEDWHLISQVYEHLYDTSRMFDWYDVLKLMREYPDLSKINEHVEQKKLEN